MDLDKWVMCICLKKDVPRLRGVANWPNQTIAFSVLGFLYLSPSVEKIFMDYSIAIAVTKFRDAHCPPP